MRRMNVLAALALMMSGLAWGAWIPRDSILVAVDNASVVVLDKDTLSVIQTVTGLGRITAAARQSNGQFVLASSTGSLYLRNADLSDNSSRTGFDEITAVAVQSDDKIVLADIPAGQNYGGRIVQCQADLQTIKVLEGYDRTRGIGIQSNDNVIIGSGQTTSGSGMVYRYTPDLTTCLSYLTEFDPVMGIAIQSDDKIIVTDTVPGTTYGRVLQRNADLSVTPNYLAEYGPMAGLAVQSDDSVVFSDKDVWYRIFRRSPDLMTGLYYEDGFDKTAGLGVQSDDKVILASETGYVYKFSADMSSRIAVSGLGNITGVWVAGAVPPEPGSGSVRGIVLADGYLGDNTTIGVKFEFRPVGGGNALVQTVLLNADGTFQISGLDQIRYNIVVKAYSSLAAGLDGVQVTADKDLGTIHLKGADSNGDNAISFEDFAILQNNYGQNGAAANPLAAAATGGCGGLGLLIVSILGLALRCRD